MQDGTYKNSMAAISTSLESTLGIICACIVVMRPLFGKVFPDRFKLGEKTKKLSSDPSSTSGSRLSRTAGWLRPKSHPRGLCGNGAESHNRLGPGTFQRLEEDIFPLSPMGGQPKATNITTIGVGTGEGADRSVVDSEIQYSKRSLSPGTIMVKKEWGVDSLVV